MVCFVNTYPLDSDFYPMDSVILILNYWGQFYRKVCVMRRCFSLDDKDVNVVSSAFVRETRRMSLSLVLFQVATCRPLTSLVAKRAKMQVTIITIK